MEEQPATAYHESYSLSLAVCLDMAVCLTLHGARRAFRRAKDLSIFPFDSAKKP